MSKLLIQTGSEKFLKKCANCNVIYSRHLLSVRVVCDNPSNLNSLFRVELRTPATYVPLAAANPRIATLDVDNQFLLGGVSG